MTEEITDTSKGDPNPELASSLIDKRVIDLLGELKPGQLWSVAAAFIGVIAASALGAYKVTDLVFSASEKGFQSQLESLKTQLESKDDAIDLIKTQSDLVFSASEKGFQSQLESLKTQLESKDDAIDLIKTQNDLLRNRREFDTEIAYRIRQASEAIALIDVEGKPATVKKVFQNLNGKDAQFKTFRDVGLAAVIRRLQNSYSERLPELEKAYDLAMGMADLDEKLTGDFIDKNIFANAFTQFGHPPDGLWPQFTQLPRWKK